ncbi:hypothetical protein EBZ37_09580 [bacterium]|nr:hypothetical protein [bacterium]
MIQTLPHPSGDIETAANGFMANALIEATAADIGVRLVPASPLAQKNRWLWISQRPERWPLSVLETLGLMTRVLWRLLTKSMAPRSGETLEHWGNRALGAPATQKLLATAVLGIYASPISMLSATLVIGRFFNQKKQSRKPRAKLKGTVAPEKGMGEWFEKMRDYLKTHGVEFIQGEQAPLEAAEVPTFICTSAPEAARMVEKLAPELSHSLAQIEMLPIVTVNGFRSKSTHRARGFGCLFHPKAGFNSLGVLWCSDIFPHRFQSEKSAENWILGGRLQPQIASLSDSEILHQVQQDRRRLPLDGELEEIRITRWPKAFPFYDIQLERRLADLPPAPHNTVLCGNYLGSLGLSQIALRTQKTIEEFAS